MAGELQTPLGLTGQTVYFLIRSSTSGIYDGASYVSYVSSNYSNYPVLAAEQGTSGYYVGTIPVGSPADNYSVLAKLQAGGSPAESDVDIADGNLEWNGSQVIAQAWLVLTQPIPTSNTAETLGDALNAARAQGFGSWKINLLAKTLTLYAADGVTAVHVFNLDSVTAPTQRT